jgi:hypothetical protein
MSNQKPPESSTYPRFVTLPGDVARVVYSATEEARLRADYERRAHANGHNALTDRDELPSRQQRTR